LEDLGVDGRIILKCIFNPLNAQLNPICHLLALFGAHHILHVGRIMVKPWDEEAWTGLIWPRI
jgi:hypothetical protein